MQEAKINGTERKKYVQSMFNSISYRYDFLNHLLSGGMDIYWRRKAISKLNIKPDALVLDIACGTGDLAFTVNKLKKSRVIALDIAKKMLYIGKQKSIKNNTKKDVHFIAGDGENIPFNDNTFDAVTIAFGVRNMGDIKKNIAEMSRVIKSDGELVILEFSNPKSEIFKKLYHYYFHKVLPKIGNLISKDKKAYTYLPVSVEYFPKPKEFIRWIEDEEFSPVNYWRLFNGITIIYKGIKK